MDVRFIQAWLGRSAIEASRVGAQEQRHRAAPIQQSRVCFRMSLEIEIRPRGVRWESDRDEKKSASEPSICGSALRADAFPRRPRMKRQIAGRIYR